MRSKWIIAFAVSALSGGAAIGIGLSGPGASATPASGVTTQVVESAVFDAMNLHAHGTPAEDWGADIQTRGQTDVYVVENTFAPGGTTGWHSHPGPSLIYVASGSVTNYSSDQPTCAGVTYTAGQTFLDPADVVHMVVNTGTVPAQVNAVQFIPHGNPRKDDAPVPANCSPTGG